MGIEVKSRDGAHPKDARALRSLAAAAGAEWRGGLVVHSGNRMHPLAPDCGVWSVPVHRLL